MTSLPNPFESALAPAMAADSAAAPGLTDPPVAVAVTFSESTLSIPTASPTAAATNETPVAAASLDREDYIPELFSSFVRRRCMDIVNPPLPQECRREYEPDMDALYDAIMPPEPPPLFLRSPSKAFMRALFELTH